jgi:cyclophilin family peptidyl-prolyl cis-trans isomerase
VPSAKRARIRENRERSKQEELARKRRKKLTRNGVVAVVVAAIVLYGIYLLTRPTKHIVSRPAAATVSCPNPDGNNPKITAFSHYPPSCLKAGYSYTATVDTTAGTFELKLEPNLGPKSANAFYVLSLYHFYDGTKFFRVIPGFVIQGGSPTNTNTGSPGFSFSDKNPPKGSYRIGTVAMANAGVPDTNGSQFFIISGPAGEQLPNTYSIIGQVTRGLSVINRINDAGNSNPDDNGMPPRKTYEIVSIRITTTKS